jgi:Cu2+-exporting ATPase
MTQHSTKHTTRDHAHAAERGELPAEPHAEHLGAGSHGGGDHPAPGHEAHGGHAGHAGHGDHAAMFRERFWVTLALAIPVVLYSEMVQMWLGSSPPAFPGSQWVAPVLGTVIFFWGAGRSSAGASPRRGTVSLA